METVLFTPVLIPRRLNNCSPGFSPGFSPLAQGNSMKKESMIAFFILSPNFGVGGSLGFVDGFVVVVLDLLLNVRKIIFGSSS